MTLKRSVTVTRWKRIVVCLGVLLTLSISTPAYGTNKMPEFSHSAETEGLLTDDDTPIVVVESTDVEHNLGTVSTDEERQALEALANENLSLEDLPVRIREIISTVVSEETIVTTVKTNELASYLPFGSGTRNAGGPGCYTTTITVRAYSYLGFILRYADTTTHNWCYNSAGEFTSDPWVTRASTGKNGWVACGWTGVGEGASGSGFKAVGYARFSPGTCSWQAIGHHHYIRLTVYPDGDYSWTTT